MNCVQPGCSGQIEDGYCDVCGSPGAVAVETVAAGRCAQPGCTGQIEDGYCNVCGTPASASQPPQARNQRRHAKCAQRQHPHQ